MTDTEDRIARARELDLRTEARRLGLDVTKDGKGFFNPAGRGPKAKSPSGSFYRKQDVWRWHLFSDGSGGDVIDLVCWMRGCTLLEALDDLLRDNKPDLPPIKYEEVAEDNTVVPYVTRRFACSAFLEALDAPPPAMLAWLLEKYGITAESAERHGFRFAHEENANRAMQSAISATDVMSVMALGLAVDSKASGLLNCPWGWGGWLVIPYRDRQGNCGHLQARRWHRSEKNKGKGPKYRHVRGEVPYPWGLSLDTDERPMLVEGALDAVRLRQEGLPAIGVPGTSWVRPERAGRLSALSSAWLVGFDGDAAGRKAQGVVAGMLTEAGAEVAQVRWEDGWEGDWCDHFADPAERFSVEEPRPPLELAGGTDMDGWSFADLLTAGADEQVEIAAGTLKRPGYAIGIEALDLLSRIMPGGYHLFCGRSGDGKTHMCLSFGVSMAAKYGIRNHFVSLEMTKSQLQERIVDGELGLGKNHGLSPENLTSRSIDAYSRRHNLPFWFTECSPLWSNLKRHLDWLANREDYPQVIWIDYGQEVVMPGEKGIEARGAAASKALKAWVQENRHIALCVAVQLNRPQGKETGRMPTRWDVRGSNQWTQDADYIALLFNPSEADPHGQDPEVRKVIVDKVRNGAVGAVDLRLPQPFGWFTDLTATQEYQQVQRQRRDKVFSK
jgi:hypothetical protein